MYQKLHKARQDHVCSGCGKLVTKGTKYYQAGLIPKNKDFHVECLPKTEPTPVTETKVKAGPGIATPEAVFESTMIEPKTDPAKTKEPEKPNPVQVRDANGRFVKKEVI